MNVIEHFFSIQGEGGATIGKPSYFIRFSGCVLKCLWCDSKFSWNSEHGGPLENYDFLKIIGTKATNVVVTGGEPFIHINNDQFIKFIADLSLQYMVTIETTGLTNEASIFGEHLVGNIRTFFSSLDKYRHKKNKILFSVSPKFDKSSYINGVEYSNIFRFYSMPSEFEYAANVYYKFVYSPIMSGPILSMTYELPQQFIDHNVFLMPLTPVPFNHSEYIKNCQETALACKELRIRYSPRIHIDIWGLKREV